MYLMGGSDDPQTHILPYHMKQSDDDGSRWPASAYSLAVDIVERATTSGTQLESVVIPDGGRLRFEWGAWSILESNAALRSLGSGPSVLLNPPGLYNVVLDVELAVRERSAPVFVRVQRIVYVRSAAQGVRTPGDA